MLNRNAHLRPYLAAWLAASLAMLAPLAAHAQTTVEVARNWGLVGSWSDDCSIPASRAHAWIVYVVRDGRLYYEQELGNGRSSQQVARAALRPDGTIEVVILFPTLSPPQTRLNVNMKGTNGRYRTLISKNVDTDEYSIKDGIFTQTGQPSKWLSRCR